MVFKMLVYVYVKHKSMLKMNIQKTYSLVLFQCGGLLKSKLKKSKGWSESFTKFDVLKLIKIIKFIIFKS